MFLTKGFFEILMITLISSKKVGGYKIMRNTVLKFSSNSVDLMIPHDTMGKKAENWVSPQGLDHK